MAAIAPGAPGQTRAANAPPYALSPTRRHATASGRGSQGPLCRQEGLCDALEGLADGLPARVDTHGAPRLPRSLRQTPRRCHLEEGTVIFPALTAAREGLAPILDRLRIEHMEDEDHAGYVHDAIAVFVSRRTGRGTPTGSAPC